MFYVIIVFRFILNGGYLMFIKLLFLLVFLFPYIANAQQMSLVTNADMNFGIIEFDSSYNGVVSLGTNGNLVVTGTGLIGSGVTSAGDVKLMAATGVIEVRCSDSALLKEVRGAKLFIDNIEVSINNGVSHGSGTTCLGNKGRSPITALLDMSVTPNPNILIGGQVIITQNDSLYDTGNYSTQLGGAKPVELSFVFQ